MSQRNPQVTEVETSQNREKKSQKSAKKSAKNLDKAEKRRKIQQKVLLASGILGIVAGLGLFVATFALPKEVLRELTFPKIPSATTENDNIIYSKLTGLELEAGQRADGPTYCVQIPNGSTDGARPQAGLDTAGVVFEAIAESGITRFAAVFQEPSAAVIGPIRSLRIYYLRWDTPFDCTIVHAGGAPDALAAVRSYKDLSESYEYMYRSSVGGRLWNNLFTTSADLAQFGTDRGYNSSDVKGFARMMPAEAATDLVNRTAVEKLVITEASDANTSAVAAEVSEVRVNFGRMPNYNVVYNYDITNNTWARGFESGAAHEVYSCPAENLGEVAPEYACSLKQLAPSVVAVMVVNESLASDNYHENITVTGSGEAYVFQNGGVIRGRWTKMSDGEQIKFSDASGAEIKLVPGQTFVEAVPGYGSVSY